jgi:hypothetical protein
MSRQEEASREREQDAPLPHHRAKPVLKKWADKEQSDDRSHQANHESA